MIPFAVIAVAMVAIALAWLVVPLLRQRRTASIAREASNVAILRDQLKELDADLRNGAVSPEQHQQARRELEQRVLEESVPQQPAQPTSVAATSAGRRTVWALAAVIPVAAIALYALWGNFESFSPMAQTSQHQMSSEQIGQMVAKLEARLQKEPENADGWLVLARTYYSMGRYQEATRAFERASKLIPDDASLLADYADALGATQQSLQGKPTELVAQALKIDPRHWKALALAGTAAFDRQDFKQAVAYWEQLKAVAPADLEMAKTIDSSIAEARQLGGLAGAANAGAPMPATSAPNAPTVAKNAPAGSPAAPAMPGSKLEGTVSLSPQVAAKASPDDLVFIFARAAEGPRMPLAIIKRQVKDLPAPFTLDDSTSMAPNMTLSSFPEIVVGARVSKSGNAMPASGDLEGVSLPVKAGATGVKVVIDRAVP